MSLELFDIYVISLRWTCVFVEAAILDIFSDNIFITWNYNIRRNVNSGFSVVTMRRVAIIFFEWGVVKGFMQKF